MSSPETSNSSENHNEAATQASDGWLNKAGRWTWKWAKNTALTVGSAFFMGVGATYMAPAIVAAEAGSFFPLAVAGAASAAGYVIGREGVRHGRLLEQTTHGILYAAHTFAGYIAPAYQAITGTLAKLATFIGMRHRK